MMETETVQEVLQVRLPVVRPDLVGTGLAGHGELCEPLPGPERIRLLIQAGSAAEFDTSLVSVADCTAVAPPPVVGPPGYR